MGGTRRRLWISLALVAVLLAALGAAYALSTWGEVNRVAIQRPAGVSVEAAEEPEVVPSSPEAQGDAAPSVSVPPSGDGLDVFLLVGSDSRAELDSLEGFGAFEGERADVAMVLIRPRSGHTAAVLSLPRDLLVEDVCDEGKQRLNEALAGCGDDLNGPSTLMFTVEELIGIPIDHLAMVDLAGFQEAVDAIGGYEICLERAVRDRKALLDLPAGCTLASGEQTLAWMRSRSTQELTADGWRTVPGVNDLARNERQREFMTEMMSRLSDFTSPTDIGVVAQSVAPYVTVDDDLSLLDAIGLAWTMRGLGDSVQEIEVPVRYSTTTAGAAVLEATVDVRDLVADYLALLTT